MKKLFILILIILLAADVIGQGYSVPDGFRWTDKKEYLKEADTKQNAIDLCKRAFILHGKSDVNKMKVHMQSNVPIFWYIINPSNKKIVTLIYCIKYKEGYDVIVKQIRNKDTYFFSFEEENGEIIDLFYEKP